MANNTVRQFPLWRIRQNVVFPTCKGYAGHPVRLHFHELDQVPLFAFFHALPSSFLGRDIKICGNTKSYPTNTPELDPLTRGSPRLTQI